MKLKLQNEFVNPSSGGDDFRRIDFYVLAWLKNCFLRALRALFPVDLSTWKSPCVVDGYLGITSFGLAAYWKEVGEKKALVGVLKLKSKAKSYRPKEALFKSLVQDFPGVPVVVLYNFHEQKLVTLAERLPGIKASVLLESEYLVLPCLNVEIATELKNSFPSSLCDSLTFFNGVSS